MKKALKHWYLGGGYATPIGDLLNDSYQRASLGDDYTLVEGGSGSASIVSNKLRYAQSDSTALGVTYLYYTGFGVTMLNNFYTSVTYILPTLGTATNGISVGIKSRDENTARSILGFFNTKTDSANYRKIQIFQREWVAGTPANNSKKISTGTLAISSGDTIKIEVSMQDLLFSVTVTNVTTSNTLSDSYQFTLSSPNLIHTPGRPCLWNTGGSFDVTNFTFGSNDYKNSHVALWGNSTTQGVQATSLSDTWPYSIEQNITNNKRVTKCGLGSAISDDLAASVDNALLINARYNVVMIGTNDISRNIGGDGKANALANIATFVTALQNAGKTVYVLTPIARDAHDMSPIATDLVSTYGAINMYALTKETSSTQLDAAYDSGDGTHMSDAGNALFYNYLVQERPLIL